MARFADLIEEDLVNLIQGNGPSKGTRSEDARSALEELLGRHYDFALRICLAELGIPSMAEDCAQEVMIQVAKSISGFRGNSKFSTWLFIIVRRTVSRFRKKAKRQLAELAPTDDFALEEKVNSNVFDKPGELGPEQDLIGAESRTELLNQVRSLPEKQRYAVMLHYFEDCSVEEAAERLGCSVSSLKTHLFRARKKLKLILEN